MAPIEGWTRDHPTDHPTDHPQNPPEAATGLGLGAINIDGSDHPTGHPTVETTEQPVKPINQKTKPSSSELEKTSSDTAVAELVIPDAAIQTPNSKRWGNADDLKAAGWIHAKVLITNPTLKTPNWPAWANDVRLLQWAGCARKACT